MESRSSQPVVPAARTLRGGVEPGAITMTESEAYQTLLARAYRRTGVLPPETVVRHVLSVTRGGDWPVQHEALDAILRRCASARADEIQIVERPRGRILRLYATRRRGSRAQPYRTLLRRIYPLDSSCECADFLRNSLGLCKHMIAVLEHVISKRRRPSAEPESPPPLPPLSWDPVRPLIGRSDWLARIRWADGVPRADVRRWLRRANGNTWTIVVPDPPRQRLALVERLIAALHDSTREPALRVAAARARATRARDRRWHDPGAPARCAAHPETNALPLSARRSRTISRSRTAAPGR
jgi:hypothetical protein